MEYDVGRLKFATQLLKLLVFPIAIFLILCFWTADCTHATEIIANIIKVSNLNCGSFRMVIDKGANDGIRIGQKCDLLLRFRQDSRVGSGRVVGVNADGTTSIVKVRAGFAPMKERDIIVVGVIHELPPAKPVVTAPVASQNGSEATFNVAPSDTDLHEEERRKSTELDAKTKKENVGPIQTKTPPKKTAASKHTGVVVTAFNQNMVGDFWRLELKYNGDEFLFNTLEGKGFFRKWFGFRGLAQKPEGCQNRSEKDALSISVGGVNYKAYWHYDDKKKRFSIIIGTQHKGDLKRCMHRWDPQTGSFLLEIR